MLEADHGFKLSQISTGLLTAVYTLQLLT
jgi:predicted amino acid racemase